MSVEMAGVEELGAELGEAIASMQVYEDFEDARRRVQRDETAQSMIDDFEQQRQAFFVAQQAGDATHDDLVALQRAQQELHSLPVMKEYLEAQTALNDRLERINELISEPLVVDFGEQAGGCCHD